MKYIRLATTILIIFLPLSSVLRGEMIQLIKVQTEARPDEVRYYSANELTEIQSIRNNLITFVKSPIKSKTKLVSSKYKGIFKDTFQALSRAFDKESYLKMDLRKIEYFGDGRATAEANLYWAFEGYEGVQTFHFSLVKENGQWLVDWTVY
jgi:hypothetical protein